MLFITAITVLASILQVTADVFDGPLTINTVSNPTVCEPVQFTWSGGEPPFYLSIIPGGQPAAPAMVQFPVQDEHSLTWIVELPAGTSFTSELRDETGTIAYSDIQTVQNGPDQSCISGTSNAVPAPPATPTTTSRPPSTATIPKPTAAITSHAATTGNPTAVHVAGASSAGISSSSARPSTTSSTVAHSPTRNAAGATAGSIGIVGFLGFLGAALLG